jgi:DNA-binding NarL/FixJ family response regulator
MEAVLEQMTGVAIVAEVADAEQLLAAIRHVRHDVMVVGLGLLREVGVAPFRERRRSDPDYRILVHSYEWDPGFGVEASGYGVSGYFSHECSADDLRAGVVEVAAGKPFITLSLGAALATAACFRADSLPHASLSPRERDIFKMLAIGVNLRGIAAQLGLSVQDVVDCKWRIMAKMNVPRAGELVRHAIDQSCRYRPPPAATGEHLRI